MPKDGNFPVFFFSAQNKERFLLEAGKYNVGRAMSSYLALSEAGLREVTCIVRERRLRSYGHVARLATKGTIMIIARFFKFDFYVQQ